MDVVAAEAERRWPGRFGSQWTIGARGVRFWDATAARPDGAQLYETGVMAWTGEQRFKQWQEIFGPDWVRQFRESKAAEAVRLTWTDGSKYYRRGEDGRWLCMGRDVFKDLLASKHKLARSAGKSEFSSEMEDCLTMIHTTKATNGVGPLPHLGGPVVRVASETFLNTSDARLITPACEPIDTWGEGFPWLAWYLGGLFRTDEQLVWWLAWTQRWLAGLYRQEWTRGQVLFLGGPPNTGKTFLSWVVLGTIVDGAADASRLLIDGKNFSDSVFKSALWCIDDSSPADPVNRRKMSTAVKALAANARFHYDRKFGWSGALPVGARLIITFNLDEEGYDVLPNMSQSLGDKVSILQTSDREVDFFGHNPEELVRSEAPAFVKWLLHADLGSVGTNQRFGTDSYHDVDLVEEAEAQSPSIQIIEILDMFLEDWFTLNPDATEWRGTASELLVALNNCTRTSVLVHSLRSPVILGRRVAKACEQRPARWSRFRTNTQRGFVLLR